MNYGMLFSKRMRIKTSVFYLLSIKTHLHIYCRREIHLWDQKDCKLQAKSGQHILTVIAPILIDYRHWFDVTIC
jgi:hypothetical protein